MKDLTEYIQWMKVHKKSTPRTRELYVYNLQRFFKHKVAFTQSTIDSYFADVHDSVEGKEISKSHANTFIAAVNSYNEFTEYQGDKKYKTPSYFKVNTLPNYTDFEAFEEIIDSFEWIFQNTLQKKALAMTLLYLPLRKSDFVSLKRSQFDLENGYLRFHIKKTDNEIKIPIYSNVIPILQLYFMKDPEVKNAFNTSIRAVDYVFEKIEEYHNIRITPHMLRGTFAVYYLKHGGRLVDLQQILGHKSIETTARYARLVPEDLKKSVEDVFRKHKKGGK